MKNISQLECTCSYTSDKFDQYWVNIFQLLLPVEKNCVSYSYETSACMICHNYEQNMSEGC